MPIKYTERAKLPTKVGDTTKLEASKNEFGKFNFIKDIVVATPQWIFVLSCVFLHTMITYLVAIPGCGRGYIGPGGLHEHGKYFNCTGGVAGYIDRAIFGEHMYHHATCHSMYETTQYFDPEGILSVLTSVFLGYLGFQAGRIYHVYTSPIQKVVRWSVWGVVACLIGGLLCNFSKNGGVIPLNKNLWSLSFVLVLGGLGFLIQACLYMVVDVKRKWGGRPFFIQE
ncbi:hypothetical protein MML48_1g03820 [Holotrichia oblita]|uniref:Uncharacterized protein n=1 Tax=Holotrichia oblita TaxID=644536 RepID=A0ACB9TUN6_HOLOL|nr:hypothetical protein MML48_1g03820 [Holotrichia oblita]